MTSPRPIRLAYLVSQYPAVNHTYILREIRGLRELGFEVPVVSIRPPDRPFDRLTEIEQAEAKTAFTVLRAGVVAVIAAHLLTMLRHPMRYFGGVGYAVRLAGANLRAMLSNLFYFAEAIVAGKHLEDAGISHFHSHFSSTVALLLSRVFPIGFSMTIHGPAEFDDLAGFYLREKVARAGFVRAISDYGASQLMRASAPEHWPNIEVVRLGVDTKVFAARTPPTETQRIELLCVGSLAPPKAHAVLIAAVDRLMAGGRTNLHLRLAGDGSMRLALEKMVRDRNLQNSVTFEGACNQDRVLDLYRKCTLFVLPSFAEGVPVVLMEAMAMEVPCIATWITGIPELIRHGVDGWLIPPGSEPALADAMARLVDDPELRMSLARSGRARVRELYELGRNTETLAGVFRKRLNS